jgi:hypothetical protein
MPIGERRRLMRASIEDREVFAADMKHPDGDAAEVDNFATALWDLANSCYDVSSHRRQRITRVGAWQC